MSRPLPHYPTQTQRTARADKTGLIPGRPGEAPDAKLVAQLAHVGRVLLVVFGLAVVICLVVYLGWALTAGKG